MGNAVYGRTFEVVAAPHSRFPVSHSSAGELGRHLEGARVGFDLGASDRKAAAVLDGEVVFSEEIAWDPATHPDPQWHYDQIMDSLRRAAAHLPRVDAIGTRSCVSGTCRATSTSIRLRCSCAPWDSTIAAK